MENKETSCIILAGGASKRMKSDKALLQISGKSIIEILIERIAHPGPVIVISNAPEDYKLPGISIHKDIIPGRGPLSGIHAGLFYSTTQRNLFLLVDMPLVSSEFINYMINHESSKQVVLPESGGRVHNIPGIYSKSCFETADQLLKESFLKESLSSMYRLVERTGSEVVNIEGLPFYSPDLFFNMNTEEDFRYVEKVVNRTYRD